MNQYQEVNHCGCNWAIKCWKSSLINSLRRSRVANVGTTLGLTRSLQEVQLDKNIKLLDCPGVVMLKSQENNASVALRNCKRIEKLDDPIAPVDDYIQKVVVARGKRTNGGVADVDAAARIILHGRNEAMLMWWIYTCKQKF
ncbi:hypothetical protein RIF29_28766 [Crotalaria pallida]|uniref:G domain-containing protein n=1 Tax=Crotalaria pallida TaxID=3830 RepID=A0AAN9EDD2_CROPI